MKFLKYCILTLVFLNLPSVSLILINSTISNILSLLTFGLLLLYYIFSNKSNINIWLILLGIFYFLISSLSGQKYLPVNDIDFFIYIIKYYIYIICGYELIKKVNNRDILIFTLLGALTIIINATLLTELSVGSGRLGGFYLNPNKAGFICLIGYCLSYSLPQNKLKFLSQIIFTLCGLLTFSRTFFLIWIILNLIVLKIDVKNVKVFIYGFGLLFCLVSISEILNIQTTRLDEVKALLYNDSVNSNNLTSDYRTDTWALYIDELEERPFFGNGFDSFGGNTSINKVGVHNTYLKIFGEAGIFVFLFALAMFLVLLKKSYEIFNLKPYIFLAALSLILYISTTHNFFDLGYLLFLTMWIQANVYPNKYNKSVIKHNSPELQ